MPPGTWYVPIAQMQKHWVQAMLNEDTYTPFPYFYDVTAWSQPLLFNVHGGYSGRPPTSTRGESASSSSRRPMRLPSSRESPCSSSRRTTRPRSSRAAAALPARPGLEGRLHDVTAAGIARGALDRRDVLVVPNGPAGWGLPTLARPDARRFAAGSTAAASDRLAWRRRVRCPAWREHGRARGSDLGRARTLFRVRSTATARCTPRSATRPRPFMSTTAS